MRATDKADRRHARRDRGADAGRRILDHDAVMRRRSPTCVAARRNRSGCGLPAATSLAENTLWLEETRQAGHFQAEPDAVERARMRRRISVRAARTGRAPHAALPAARRAAAQRRRARPSRRSACGSLLSGRLLDLREHVGGPAAGEIARDQAQASRGCPHAGIPARPRGRDWLAVHQYAIAVEDDHRDPLNRPETRPGPPQSIW